VRVLFVRHGESVSNSAIDRVGLPEEQGDRLTELGREQSRVAARALRTAGAARLISSSMRRAIETAEVLAPELGLEVEVDPELAELRESEGFGELEPAEQAQRRWSTWMSERGEAGYAPPGAESFADVLGRVRRVKARLQADPRSPAIAVTHGIFLRFFLADSLLGERFEAGMVDRLWQLDARNCGICTFEVQPPDPIRNPAPGRWRCVSWMCATERDLRRPVARGGAG
jgi:broad specificity phosphatase PhoE